MEEQGREGKTEEKVGSQAVSVQETTERNMTWKLVKDTKDDAYCLSLHDVVLVEAFPIPFFDDNYVIVHSDKDWLMVTRPFTVLLKDEPAYKNTYAFITKEEAYKVFDVLAEQAGRGPG